MAWYSGILNYLADAISTRLKDQRDTIQQARDYRLGKQRKQLKVKSNQYDDNVRINFSGLLIDRMVEAVLGDTGPTFDLPGEGETPAQTYIDEVWKVNRSKLFMKRVLLLASDAGTGYIKMIKDGQVTFSGDYVPRLEAVRPEFVTMETDPYDADIVIRYIIQYTIQGPNGKEKAIRQTIQHVAAEVAEDGTVSGGDTWETVNEETQDGKWIETSRDPWPYYFPPIISWQNMILATGPYGEPDLTDDIIEIQDRINFNASNMNKLIRLQAGKVTWGKMLGDLKDLDLAPDKLNVFDDPQAELNQLEALGDLPGAFDYLKWLKQSMFDIACSVDNASVSGMGDLTNFRVKIVYQDFLKRVEGKRELFGEALTELNRRMLILAEMESDPGEVVWPDVLPPNETENAAAISQDLSNKLVSRQTASERRGYDFTQESERMEADTAASDAQAANIGSNILSAFSRGQ